MTKTPDPRNELNLVTGATGLLGSHFVEQLRRQGRPVRVLVRPDSNRKWLQTQGVEFVEGDVTDPASLARACAGVGVVYHAAAKVGDWGPWSDFQRITIDGTRNMISAARDAGVRRFVHVSSISTYGYHTGPYVVDESYDLGFGLYKWAYYTKSKIEAEQTVWEFFRRGGIEVSVIRPAWIYGERDRVTIARLVTMLKAGRAKILGKGDNKLNVVYAGNIAEAAILAADNPIAIGEAYNISNDAEITQQEYFDLWARTIGAPQVTRHVPYGIAYRAGHVLEILGHLTNSKKPPFITRYAVWLMGRQTFFTTQKAREQLGWKPTVTYDTGVPRTAQWFFNQAGGADAKAAPAMRAAS